MADTVIPEATHVKVRLEQQLSSSTAEEGQPVQLAVAEEIKVNDAVVLPVGAVVNGTVVQAVPKRRMGRTGKLDFSIDNIIAPDGGKIPLRYTLIKKEGGSHAVRTGVITAGVAVAFWPAAPFMLLMKGKDTAFNKGMVLEVFTDTPYKLKPSAEKLADKPEGKALAGATAAITSDPAGGDIEIDGVFVGSTPSTVQMTPGSHKVKITKGTAGWERIMEVKAGSSLTLNATLNPSEPRTSSADRLTSIKP
jgi:hypothetical protein